MISLRTKPIEKPKKKLSPEDQMLENYRNELSKVLNEYYVIKKDELNILIKQLVSEEVQNTILGMVKKA